MSELIETSELVLLVLGLAAFGVVLLPHLLSRRPLSYPIIFVAGGAILFSLPLGLPDADPITYPWTDWLDTVFDPAPIQEHTVGLSGGNELARFNLSWHTLRAPNSER